MATLTYGSHVAVRLGTYWFDGTGNPEGCTSLSNNSGVGVSTTAASEYVIESASGKAMGTPVLYGDLFTLTDLSSNQVLQITHSKCVLSRPGDNSQNMLLSLSNTLTPNYNQPYTAPYFTGPSQPTVPINFPVLLSASYLQYSAPTQLGYISISTAKGGRVEVNSKWTGQPCLYVTSLQPPLPGPPPPPCTGPSCPNPNFPNPNDPYCLDPNGCATPPSPPASGPSKDILYVSAAVSAVGLGLVAWGWYGRKTVWMYAGAGLAIAGGGGGIYYLIRKKDDPK